MTTDCGRGEKSERNRGEMRILVSKSKGGRQEEIIQGEGEGRILID